MNDALSEIVRRAIAVYLDADPAEIRPGHRFLRDLSLHPLDVALIMLDIEEMEEIELPIEHMDAVETVSDLIHLLRKVRDGERQDEVDRPETHAHPRLPRSGSIRKAGRAVGAYDGRPFGYRVSGRAR